MGGADIANKIFGTIELKDTIEQLAELFEPEKILPVAWMCDYDFEENIYIPDVDPNQENALLKLQYEIIPDDSEEETESTEPGTEEGTESTDPSEPSTEETGQPTTPPDEDETTDPTDEPTEIPTEPSEPEETDPDDTEEPTTPTEPGTDAPDDSEQDTTPDDADPSEPSEPSQPVGDTNTDNSTQTDNSNNSVNTDNSDNSSVDNSSVDNSVTNNDSSSSSTTSNNTVDNSNVSNSSDSSTTTTNTITTTNNYYTTESNQSPSQTTAQPIVIQVQNDSAAPDADDEKVSDFGSSSPNIRIDAQWVDCVFEYVDGVYNISITAQKEADESDAVVPAVAPVQAVEDSVGQEVNWLEVIQIVLLVGILICLIWQPKRTGNRNIQGQ